ncbi:AMP-dependent synthetase/ligase [Desertibaculum subflavum]|uniref:AMP-dependent synthetase/ligase n=1 Tax=Desertibaculum subflavum TaxID=2268458 RepID=UPI000E6672E5
MREARLAEDTLPKLLRRNARTMAGKPALREKRLGIWQTLTWADYHRHVVRFAAGLAALGFGRGHRLTVIGDNRPRLYVAQLAAQSLGGIAVPVYQDAIASELVYVLNHAETSVIVAEDQEQVDKIVSIRDQLPALAHIVYADGRGMQGYEAPWLHAFEAVEAAGDAFAAQYPSHVESEIERGATDDIAMLCYTSGTTGNPKGVMLSHANMLATAQAFVSVEDIRADDDWLAYLPMAWVGDALYSTVLSLLVGFACNCPESPETVQRDLRELGPTAVLAPPRIWENMLTGILLKSADASPLKRATFDFFRKVAEAAELARSEGKPVGFGTRLLLGLGEFLVYGPVRDQLGLRRARWAYTGGAPLGPDAFRFIRAIGVNLKQLYGSTETSALVASQSNDRADANTVGLPVPGVEIRIDAGGEVLVRGGGIFCGYFKQDDATREAIDPEGWFRTGDAGFIDPQGNLVIVDRAKDVGKLADGTPFAPQFVENKLKFSPFVREAIAFGHERPFVVAMLAIDLQAVGNWAERQGLAYTSFMDLSQKPEVRALIGQEVERCNAGLQPAARIRRFLLLTKEFDADDAEITRTRKLRRKFITEKYGPVIEAFYGGATDAELVFDVTYEDGRRATLRTPVVIADIGEPVAAKAREPAHV